MHSAPPVGAGDSTVGSNPAANPCVTRRTERLKNLSLLRESCSACKIFQLRTQKSFSSIAHYEQSSKKYFAEDERVGRARDMFDGKFRRRIDVKLKLRRRARVQTQAAHAIASERSAGNFLEASRTRNNRRGHRQWRDRSDLENESARWSLVAEQLAANPSSLKVPISAKIDCRALRVPRKTEPSARLGAWRRHERCQLKA
jgi:hypothetical protein